MSTPHIGEQGEPIHYLIKIQAAQHITKAKPTIKANLASMGDVDPKSVECASAGSVSCRQSMTQRPS
jgi:hypothetical protein